MNSWMQTHSGDALPHLPLALQPTPATGAALWMRTSIFRCFSIKAKKGKRRKAIGLGISYIFGRFCANRNRKYPTTPPFIRNEFEKGRLPLSLPQFFLSLSLLISFSSERPSVHPVRLDCFVECMFVRENYCTFFLCFPTSLPTDPTERHTPANGKTESEVMKIIKQPHNMKSYGCDVLYEEDKM